MIGRSKLDFDIFCIVFGIIIYMQFITNSDQKIGTQALADKMIYLLKKEKRVLWLVSGGSNIPITIGAIKIIRGNISSKTLQNLALTLTDERYGQVGHPDSNWKQLEDAGLNMARIKAYPVLAGLSFTDTVSKFAYTIQKLLDSTDVIVGQFGMGADGHIAGILPHSPSINETSLVSGYESKSLTRITLTFPFLRKVDVAYMFAGGAAKKAAIDLLYKDGIALSDQPAQILKEIKEAYVYIS